MYYHHEGFFKKLGLLPCKAEQPPQHVELLEKEQEINKKHIGKLFRENKKIKDAY